MAAVINWAPGIDENNPSIASQKFVEINFEDIAGYDDGDEEAIVYYWIAVSKSGSLVPGNLHQVVVRL